jgi:hypothetical protein
VGDKGEEVQARADPQFRHVEAGAQAVRQPVSGEEDVARFGQTVVERIVWVREPGGDRNAIPPFELCLLAGHVTMS